MHSNLKLIFINRDRIKLLLMNKIDFSDTDKISELFQQAVDRAIENHRQKGESIAIANEEGKVIIVPAAEIPKLKESPLKPKN